MLYEKTKYPRLVEQYARLRKLNAARSKRQESMLRTIEVKPYRGLQPRALRHWCYIEI